MKNYYTKWEWRLWLSDPAVSMCQASTRGIWMDAICAMLERQSDRIGGSVPELARVCRCSESEMEQALSEISKHKVADISEQNGNKILVCRKLSRDMEISKLRAVAGKVSANKRSTNGQQTPQQTVNKPLTMTMTITNDSPPEEGEPEGKPTVSPNLLALEAHRAFPNPPNIPAAEAVGNAAELMAAGYSPEDIRRVIEWARRPGDYKPRSAAAVLDPSRFQKWMNESKNGHRKEPLIAK